MGQDEVRDEQLGIDAGRRKLIKAAAVAGGAVAAVAVLPGEWKKPVATVGGLPAHAQTSEALIVLSNFELLGLTGGPQNMRLAVPISCDGQFHYADPLCQVGLDVTITGQVTICGQTVPFSKTLQELGATIVSGDGCAGVIKFPFPAFACSDINGVIEFVLSKGDRTSNKITAPFILPIA